MKKTCFLAAWRSLATLTVLSAIAGGLQAAPADEAPKGLSAADWSGIRAAHEASRHAVQRRDDGTSLARNPGQQWNTQFNGRGFLTIPDAGGWQWGLELQSYGFPGHARMIAKTTAGVTEGNRLTYVWDAALEEWFVNDPRGLEHGFTVRQRPDGGEGSSGLEFVLAVRGGLRPQVRSDGQGVGFMDAKGSVVLTYAGLKVWDADGRTLSSRFEPVAEGSLRLTINAESARYPITIDPIAQQVYLKAGNSDNGDHFGESVAISGDTVVVGAWGEDSGASGINRPYINNPVNYGNSGAAYVFVRSGGVWTQQAYFKSANTSGDDYYGYRVAISGNTVVVGSPYEDGSSSGVNAPYNDLAADAGAAYVYERTGTTWALQAYLKASNAAAGDYFGSSCAIFGNTIVVGAPLEDSSSGINQTPNETATDAGAVYVFTRSGSTWTQQAYLKASNPGPGDQFGISAAIDGDTVVIGAFKEDGSGTAVNPVSDELITDSGAAYVFARSGNAWTQQAYLKASNTGQDDQFGKSVAIDGNTVLIGAPYENGSGKGINPLSNESAGDSGAAYLFDRTGSAWSFTAYVKASNSGANDNFGFSVALEGGIAAVGAIQEDGTASNSGATYVFVRSSLGTWTEQAYLKAGNAGSGDHFGYSVAVEAGSVVVGANLEQGDGKGANPPDNNILDNSGAIYVFTGLGLPKIAVSQGGNILNGGSKDFGTVARNNTKSLTFTISNTGVAELTGLTPSISGTNMTNFTVSTPTTPVAPGGNTTFKVDFVPDVAGPYSAILHIPSNDLGATPFDINLTATGTVPDITIQQPANNDLTAGVSTVDFGNVLTNTNSTLTFTIKNTVPGDLTGLTASITAADSYTVTQPLATTVTGPGGSTTFTVKFAPATAGTHTATVHIASNDPDESVFDINLTGFATAPEIGVEVLSNPLTDNVTNVPFGQALTGGGYVDLEFTIHNTGDGNLTGLVITKNGTSAGMFSIVHAPTVPVAPNDSTTFTARFAPTSPGDKIAALHIACNDLDEAAFDIPVTGTGITPIPPIVTTMAAENVFFDRATLKGTVDAKGLLRATSFQYGLTTTYLGEQVASPDSVSTPTGTATPIELLVTGLQAHTKYNFRARAYGFYGGTDGKSLTFVTKDQPPVAVVDDYDVQPSATVTLNVLSNDSDPDVSDVLTLVSITALSNPAAGKLTKVGNTVVFTAAAATAFSAPVTFSYTVSDGFDKDLPPTTALVTLTPATITINPLNGPTHPGLLSAAGFYDITVDDSANPGALWSVSENVAWFTAARIPGNKVRVTYQANATKNLREGFLYVGGIQHKVSQEGVAIPALHQPDSGLLTAIVGDFYSLTILTDGAPVTYKVVPALPAGLKLDNNTGILSGIPTKGSLTPYTLTISASNAAGSAPDPITFNLTILPIPDAAIGTFHGYVERDPDLNGNLGSRLEFTTTNLGAVTGKLITGVTSTPLKGVLKTFPADQYHPTLTLTFTPKGLSAQTLELDLDATATVTGDFADGTLADTHSHGADVSAWRSTWTANHKAPNQLHSFSLEQTNPSPSLPQGFGYGSFTAKDTTGALTVSGKLADGSAFSTITFMAKDGRILIYQPLYNNLGSFAGVLQRNSADGTLAPAAGETISWLKPAPLPNSKDTLYLNGFGPLYLTVEGAIYTPPGPGALVMGLQPPLVLGDDNAELSFADGGLSPDFPMGLLISNSGTSLTNKVTIKTGLAANPYTVTMPTLTAATGIFTGTFTIPGATTALNRKVTYYGQIAKHTDGTRGYGFFILPASTAATATKLSGSVILDVPTP